MNSLQKISDEFLNKIEVVTFLNNNWDKIFLKLKDLSVSQNTMLNIKNNRIEIVKNNEIFVPGKLFHMISYQSGHSKDLQVFYRGI